jgi:cytochrome c oxidase subunit 1
MSRRLWDGGVSYNFDPATIGLNKVISHSAWGLGIAQIPFIINFFWSLKKGEKAEKNPWDATTLEWAAPSPPPHGNFVTEPTVYRGPYEYSVPGKKRDFQPQDQAAEA